MKELSEKIRPEREWILTNGLGGYSLGYGDFINKRKYNGLLIASTNEVERIHILSSIEERIEFEDTAFHLDSSHYPDSIYPDGFAHIIGSWLRPYPAVLYSADQEYDGHFILKELFMKKGSNTVIIKYTNMGEKDARLLLRPKLSLRNHHFLNSPGTWELTGKRTDISGSSFFFKREDTGVGIFGHIDGAKITPEPIVFRNIFYPSESLRGYEAAEDLFSPVLATVPLKSGKSATAVFSSEQIDFPSEDAREAETFYKSFPLPRTHPLQKQKTRIFERKETSNNVIPAEAGIQNSMKILDSRTCPEHSRRVRGNDKSEVIGGARKEKDIGTEFDFDQYEKILALAAADFVMIKADLIAGYPWFGAWGRDTLISLSGLKYLPGGKVMTENILKKYGSHIRHGLLPNTFGEGGEGLNYDTVDAPLWFVIRAFEYDPKDKELIKYCSDIVLHYLMHADLPFFVDKDGLIEIKKGNFALTWMDAKIYGEPVTPRSGKPVEINALWFNAVMALAKMCRGAGISSVKAGQYEQSVGALQELAKKIFTSLQKFAGDDILADRIDAGEPIFEVRPNFVTALSLPFDFLGHDRLFKYWQTARSELLTSCGLRTLSPMHPAFKDKYIGNHKQRDMAYHQGTVWPHLLKDMAKLAVKVMARNSAKDIRDELTGYVAHFRSAFMNGECASVAEIFDGLKPGAPKGCPAQCWSTFALLEIENMIHGGH